MPIYEFQCDNSDCEADARIERELSRYGTYIAYLLIDNQLMNVNRNNDLLSLLLLQYSA